MTNSNDQWEPCPRGTFHLMQPVPKKRTHSPFRAGLVAGIVACLLFASFAALTSKSARNDSGTSQPTVVVTCSDVMPHLADYRSGNLTAELQSQVDRHLAACEECRLFYERMAALQRDQALFASN